MASVYDAWTGDDADGASEEKSSEAKAATVLAIAVAGGVAFAFMSLFAVVTVAPSSRVSRSITGLLPCLGSRAAKETQARTDMTYVNHQHTVLQSPVHNVAQPPVQHQVGQAFYQ